MAKVVEVIEYHPATETARAIDRCKQLKKDRPDEHFAWSFSKKTGDIQICRYDSYPFAGSM